MLDGETKKILAEGKPKELRDQNTDPRVRAFFNREPRMSFHHRRATSGHRDA